MQADLLRCPRPVRVHPRAFEPDVERLAMRTGPGIALAKVESARPRASGSSCSERSKSWIAWAYLPVKSSCPAYQATAWAWLAIERDRTLESLFGRGEIGGRRSYVPTGAGQQAERSVDIGVIGVERERLVEQDLRLRNHARRAREPRNWSTGSSRCRSGPNRPWRTSDRARSPARRARGPAAGSPACAGRCSAGRRGTGCRPAGSRSEPSRCALFRPA